MEAPGHVPSVPSPKSGTGTSSALLNVCVCLRDGDSISWSYSNGLSTPLKHTIATFRYYINLSETPNTRYIQCTCTVCMYVCVCVCVCVCMCVCMCVCARTHERTHARTLKSPIIIQSPLLTSLITLCIFSFLCLVMLGHRYNTPMVTVVCPVSKLHRMASLQSSSSRNCTSYAGIGF